MRSLLALLSVAGLLFVLSRTERGRLLAADAVESVVTAFKARGLRNNNPGNLVRTSIAWKGKLKSAADAAALGMKWDETFELFSEAKWGVRAMARDLLNDAGSGSVTVDSLIREFSHTDQAAYIANVSRALGVGATDAINVRDRLPELVAAMIRQENGQQPYSQAQLREWVYLS